MKKQIDFKLLAIFCGGLLFNYLFWMERLSANLLLYSSFILIALVLDKEIRFTKKVQLFCGTHFLAALLVIYNQSTLTVIAYYISLFVFIGFAHAELIRSVFTAGFTAFLQVVSSPVNLIKRLINVRIGNFSFKPLFRPIKYIVIPFVILFVFTVIYMIANPVFAKYVDEFVLQLKTVINQVFSFLFADLSFERFMHVILGILFTAGLLLGFKEKGVQSIELTLDEKLYRKRKNRLKPGFVDEFRQILLGVFIKKKMALKTENIIAIISFSALNILLLIINSIDISTVWFGSLSTMDKSYSAELHEGTNALILSIFMAMAVIVYFFNGNLNFFSKNKTIKTLAYLWIVQNVFLVASVYLKDYQYIGMYGLTYKRIGVAIFLLLCAIGLLTVYIKVAQQKTLFYLVKVNGLAWYLTLIVLGVINWDILIVKYNIENRASTPVDVDHLMDLSDQTLPLLDQNRELLKTYAARSTRYDQSEIVIDTVAAVPATTAKSQVIDRAKLAKLNEEREIRYFEHELDRRIRRFKFRWNEYSWLSWNYRDWQAYKYFEEKR